MEPKLREGKIKLEVSVKACRKAHWVPTTASEKQA